MDTTEITFNDDQPPEKKAKKRRDDRGKRCAVFGCGNTNSNSDFGIHAFPNRDRSPERFSAWCKVVAHTRKDFSWKAATSFVCSAHFEDGKTNKHRRDMQKEMLQKPDRWQLQPDAIPSVALLPSRPKHGTPVHYDSSPGTGTGGSKNTPDRPTGMEFTTPTGRPKRNAAAKRERKRLVDEALEVAAVEQAVSMEEPMELDADDGIDDDTSVHQPVDTLKKDQICQAALRPLHRSVRVQVNHVPRRCSIGTQTEDGNGMFGFVGSIPKPTMCSTETQTDPTPVVPDQQSQLPANSCSHVQQNVNAKDVDDPAAASMSEDDDSPTADDIHDTSYHPESDYSSDDDSGAEDELTIGDDDDNEKDPSKQKKYIVFHSNLMELFRVCPVCSSPAKRHLRRIGTYLSIKQKCSNKECSFDRFWESQPLLRNVPAGNLLLSSAILFSGSSAAKALRMFQHLGCQTYQVSTFYDHQRRYLWPAVESVWRLHQQEVIKMVKESGKPVVVGGDGRSDSPGHCAKYGSYTLVELNVNRILDVQLVQSNEEGVNNSVNMEKAGLIRCVAFLQSVDIMISVIVTDRHIQINKWLRENLPEADHRFDVWHLAKNIKKKITKAAQEKDCKILFEWCKSIVNHLYWCAASTPDGNGDVILAKWLSLENHLHNRHKGHGELFPKCSHGRLLGRDRSKKWLEAGSKASVKASGIIDNAYFNAAVRKMSPGAQTSSLEAYHSLVLHFAPKMISFSYRGMYCRLLLAALHFNENGDREQATTAGGDLRWAVKFTKAKKGAYSVRPIKEDSTYNYVNQLMMEVQRRCQQNIKPDERDEIPPPLCSSYDHPEKPAAVAEYNARHRRYAK